MLFTVPEPNFEPFTPVPQAPERKELHLIARDDAIFAPGDSMANLYRITIPYLRSSIQTIRGGATHRFDIAPAQIQFLFSELGGDKITHYRRQDATKPGYRKIHKMGVRHNGIIITSYYSAGRIIVDFSNS